MASTLALPDPGLLTWYDALDEDPPGHRLEIIEGVLVVSPSPTSEHQDRARGIANILDEALRATSWQVREDLEWDLEHPVEHVASRPRPDASVLDPTDPHRTRLVTVEVLSVSDHERVAAGVAEARIEAKRRVYAYGGVAGHLECEVVEGAVELRWCVPRHGRLEQVAAARGSEPLEVAEPFELRIVPDELEGWLRHRIEELEHRAEAERERTEAAAERAKAERERAEAERRRADAERDRAERAEAALRRLREAPDG